MSQSIQGPVREPGDFGTDARGVCARWQAEIRLAEQDEKRFRDTAREVEARYLDLRRSRMGEAWKAWDTQFNVLWSNIQVLLPAIYATPPKPVVQRRYLDQDPVGRAASLILQRAIQTSIEESTWHEGTHKAVLDYLLCGRGIQWARYEPHFRDVPAPQVQAMEAAEAGPGPAADMGREEAESPEEEKAEEGPQITGAVEYEKEISYEEVCWDYVNWNDFLHSPARTWPEVRWVARRVLLTKEEGTERFGKVFDDVPLTWRPDGIEPDDIAYQLFQRAVVYEVWDKPSRKVVWIAPEYGERVLDQMDDFLKLNDFFPCPPPLYATQTNSSLTPRADYVMYQDQAQLLDDLTSRITKLAAAIKAVGVYDAANDGIQRMLNEGVENELIPVQQWNSFAQAGGFKGAVDFMPVEAMAVALAQLVQVKEATKQDLYEITGISDIVRGQGEASATATAERLKGQFVQLRLRDRIGAVARYCRDMVRITGELICKHFQPQTLMLMSGYPQVTGATPEIAMQAIQLLKNDQVRGFRIEIEVDSTVIADQEAEQAARVNFLQMAGGFLKEAVPLAMQVPELATLAGQMLLFGVRGFPVGREMEAVFETALDQLQQAQQQPKPEAPPDPEMVKVQAQAQEAQGRLQLDAQVAQQQAQTEQARLQLEAQKADAEHQLEVMRLQNEQLKLELDERRMDMEHAKQLADEAASTQDFALRAATADVEYQQKRADEKASNVEMVQQAILSLQDALAKMGEQQQVLHKAVSAPKTVSIVRGPDGKATMARMVPEIEQPTVQEAAG